MRSRHLVRLALVLSCVAGVLSGPARARAADPSKAECAESYENAQERRAARRYRSALEALAICSNPACPSFIVSDCESWVSEVEEAAPSLFIAAKNPHGDDTVDVQIYMDDELIADKLTGTALAVDPGVHTFRFEMAHAEPVEQELTIDAAEQNRFIEIEFEGDGTEPAKKKRKKKDPFAEEPEPSEETEPTEEPVEPEHTSGQPGPLRPYAYVAGGVGAASLVVGTILGAMGKGEVSDMRSGCAQTPDGCSQQSVDAAHTKLVLGDVFLGVGLAGLGTGVALFFLSQPSDSGEAQFGSLRVGVTAAPTGGFARVTGQF